MTRKARAVSYRNKLNQKKIYFLRIEFSNSDVFEDEGDSQSELVLMANKQIQIRIRNRITVKTAEIIDMDTAKVVWSKS